MIITIITIMTIIVTMAIIIIMAILIIMAIIIIMAIHLFDHIAPPPVDSLGRSSRRLAHCLVSGNLLNVLIITV